MSRRNGSLTHGAKGTPAGGRWRVAVVIAHATLREREREINRIRSLFPPPTRRDTHPRDGLAAVNDASGRVIGLN